MRPPPREEGRIKTGYQMVKNWTICAFTTWWVHDRQSEMPYHMRWKLLMMVRNWPVDACVYGCTVFLLQNYCCHFDIIGLVSVGIRRFYIGIFNYLPASEPVLYPFQLIIFLIHIHLLNTFMPELGRSKVIDRHRVTGIILNLSVTSKCIHLWIDCSSFRN